MEMEKEKNKIEEAERIISWLKIYLELREDINLNIKQDIVNELNKRFIP